MTVTASPDVCELIRSDCLLFSLPGVLLKPGERMAIYTVVINGQLRELLVAYDEHRDHATIALTPAPVGSVHPMCAVEPVGQFDGTCLEDCRTGSA
jgi:hypothetical protein